MKYLYPYRNQKDRLYANTALSVKELGEQYAAKQADNFIYTFEHDIDKIDMLFSNVDDPNYTIESILNRIDDGPEFKGVSSWDDLKEQLKEFGTKGNGKSSASGILFQSWQRFRRLINNSINDDVFVNAKSMSNDLHQVYLSDEILNMNGGEMRVVDIAGLTEQLQCLVFGDIIRSVYALKHGDYFELLAMPREMIMFRSHFEENGITKKWKDLYGKLNDEQKDRLMTLVSLNVSELKKESWPDDLKDILEFYLIKYSGKKKNSDEEYIQLSLMDIADVGIENKKIM